MEPATWIFGFVWFVSAVLPGSDVAGELGQFGGGLLGVLIITSFVGWAFVQLVRFAVQPLERRIERIERRQKHIGIKVGLPDDDLETTEPPKPRGFLTFWRQ